jgi:hypothetical protein
MSQKVWDINSTCHVLHIPRMQSFDVETWVAQASTLNLAQYIAAGAPLAWLESAGHSDVLSCSWSKDTSSPAGVFNFSLKSERDYLAILKPGDLVFIFMDDKGSYSSETKAVGTLVTIGLVDRTSRSTAAGGGEVTTHYTVSGRDLGCVFQETSTVFDKSYADLEQAYFSSKYYAELFESPQKVAALSPLEYVLTILKLMYSAEATGSKMVGAQWRLQGATSSIPLTSLIDVTTFVQRTMFGYSVIKEIAIAQAGNVWSLLESYCNRVVNEMFVDVRDLTPGEVKLLDHLSETAAAFVPNSDGLRQYAAWVEMQGLPAFASQPTPTKERKEICALVFRQLPYDKLAFAALPLNEVHATEVYDIDVGHSSHDLFNFFRIRFPELKAEHQELIYGIRVFIDSIAHHGIRRLDAETSFCFLSSDASASYDRGSSTVPPADVFTDVFEYYVGLLSTWYAANDKMLAGSIVTRFKPNIRVGTRLRLWAEDGVSATDFYVQAVSHSFAVEAGGSRTSLTVVRGVDPTSKGIENNLLWTRAGSAVTDAALITTPAGASIIKNAKERVIVDVDNIDGIGTVGGPAIPKPNNGDQ